MNDSYRDDARFIRTRQFNITHSFKKTFSFLLETISILVKFIPKICVYQFQFRLAWSAKKKFCV